ncbi:MAG: YaiI/YqxD family protein [Acholeplasmatales bacterium]|nr:MAG: YaiI/YqxD family protein [Acholeplasmatales bacterium]
MKLIVDADACPVKEMIARVASTYHLEVLWVASIDHEINMASGTHIQVDAGRDAADHAIIGLTDTASLVVTQDYGLAAVCLAKGATVLHPDGWRYRHETIDGLLAQRTMHQAIRRAGGRHKGPKKRKKDADKQFETLLEAHLKM